MARNPRGHSNVHPNLTKKYPTNELLALIPLEGGSDVYSVKPLPPLALSEDDWKAIGNKMGWTLDDRYH